MVRVFMLAFFALLALAVGAYLMPQTNPYFASRHQITGNEARAIAKGFLQKQHHNVSGYIGDVIFYMDVNGLYYLMQKMGIKQVMELARAEHLPLSYWRFTFYLNVPQDEQREVFGVHVSPLGKVFGFWHTLPDSAEGATLSAEAVLQFVQHNLQNWPDLNFSEYKLEKTSSTKQARRTDHKMIFTQSTASFVEGDEILEVVVAGNTLASVTRYFREPQSFTHFSRRSDVTNFFPFLCAVMIFIVMFFVASIVFLRKYRNEEFRTQNGFWLGSLLFFSFLLSGINTWERIGFGVGMGTLNLLYVKFVQMGILIFMWGVGALATFFCWAVGEYYTRSERPQLLSGFESVCERRWATKNVGRELPIGFLFGMVAFGVIQLIIFLLVQNVNVVPKLKLIANPFEGYEPFITIVGSILTATLLYELCFRLFLISSLYRLIKSKALVIVIAGVLYGVCFFFFDAPYALPPSYIALIPWISLGLIQGFIFWHYGMLTSMASGAVFAALNQIGPLLGSSSPFFIGNALLVVGLLFGVLIIGLIGAWRGKEFVYTPEAKLPSFRQRWWSLVGQTLNHYQIEEKLGEGGVGVVYKAQDLKLNRIVALKFLKPDLTHHPEVIDRFINEAQTASALDHPNICTVYEINQTEDGQMFICMAYYPGETLQEKLRRGALPFAEALHLSTQISKGLGKAHEAGIFHRDIKPSNLLITTQSEIKIIDWGIAKLAGKTRLTKTRTTPGTVAYMSPEQVRGKPLDHRTDIWSLGVVLYEMLSGQPPFPGENEAAVIYSIVHEKPVALMRYREGISSRLQDIVVKTLEKNLRKRYQQVGEVLADLNEVKEELR